jgi:DNA-binding response OmpR family regulator
MSTDRPILIVEDDATLRLSLIEDLGANDGFISFGAGTLAEASAHLDAKDARFDAVILDIGLPDGNGVEFCAKLRRDGHKMPIIMLTGWDSEDDIVRGLNAGASDYIAKPFRSAELLARIRAQLRVFENSEDAVYDIGPYTFRPAGKVLLETARNSRIRLTDKETRILKHLYRAGSRVVDRSALLAEVWGYSPAVTTHTLETHIYRLRQKIDPSLLVTEAGGYRLNP